MTKIVIKEIKKNNKRQTFKGTTKGVITTQQKQERQIIAKTQKL